MVTGPAAPGAPAGTMTIVQAGGQLRIRFLAGSLIIANGDLPARLGRSGTVGVVLGYRMKTGLTWFWGSPSQAWNAVTRATAWKYFFYPEHVQVQLFPVGFMLLIPCGLRRWVFKVPEPWACQHCRYDRRGTPAGPCPECGGLVE